jgi:hypothetical protein
LEAHILDTSNVLGPLEVFAGSVFPALSCVIHKVLCYFTQGPPFFTEVDDYTTTSFLCFFDGLFNTKDEIWTACTDVGAENVAAVAFIVHTESETNIRV